MAVYFLRTIMLKLSTSSVLKVDSKRSSRILIILQEILWRLRVSSRTLSNVLRRAIWLLWLRC